MVSVIALNFLPVFSSIQSKPEPNISFILVKKLPIKSIIQVKISITLLYNPLKKSTTELTNDLTRSTTHLPIFLNQSTIAFPMSGMIDLPDKVMYKPYIKYIIVCMNPLKNPITASHKPTTKSIDD